MTRKPTTTERVFIIEVLCVVLGSIGIGLMVGALSASAGVGAGLLAFSASGILFVIAWERGNAGESAERRR